MDAKQTILALLAGAAFVALTVQAHGATIPLYTPGGAPCGGDCSLEWASQEAKVPQGVPMPMVVPKGSVVEWMSYARDGVPYATLRPMAFADDEPGVGYWFEDAAGNRRLMFKLDECENWSVVRVPLTLDAPPPEAIQGEAPWRSGVTPRTWSSPGYSPSNPWFGPHDECCDDEVFPPSDPEPPVIAAVPLPTPLPLLVLSLTGLWFASRRGAV